MTRQDAIRRAARAIAIEKRCPFRAHIYSDANGCVGRNCGWIGQCNVPYGDLMQMGEAVVNALELKFDA